MLLILPLVCLPIGIVGYLSFQASVHRINRLVQDEQTIKVKATAGEMNDIFDDCRLDLETIASLPVLEDYHNARAFRLSAEAAFNRDNIVRLFTDFISRTPYYDRIRYLDDRGQTLIEVHRSGVLNLPSDAMPDPVFIRARKTDRDDIHVSSITTAMANHRNIIYWAKPIFSGLREFAGVVVIDLDFEKIIDLVKAIQIGERGYAFLVDEKGRIIAHPRFAPFELTLENIPDTSLKGLIREMMTGVSGWKPYLFEKQEKVAAFAPIPNMRWALAVTITTDEYRSEALAIRSRVIKAVAITLIFAIAGVTVLTYFLLKPVHFLVRATDHIAGGDPGHEIPVQSRDELGDLTRSFNRMVKNLNQVQEELVRSEKLISLGRLSAGVAHEIRNPLNAMKGAIVHLQRRRSGDQLVEEYTHLVSEEIDRLNQVVSEFLLFARESKPKPVPTDINRLIIATQQLFEERARQGNIVFHNLLQPNIPKLMVDPNQIEQVVVNVMINAMDALPEGGDITFYSSVSDGNEASGAKKLVRLVIEDNGLGVAPEDMKNIFDPFFSTKDTGTGLGLTLSLGIIENHGGRIRIVSRRGPGTIVIIDFPVQPKNETDHGNENENHIGG